MFTDIKNARFEVGFVSYNRNPEEPCVYIYGSDDEVETLCIPVKDINGFIHKLQDIQHQSVDFFLRHKN